MSKWVITSVAVLCAAQSHAQFVNSSLEQYNYQIGDAALEIRSYDGFDEFEDVTSLTGFNQYDFRVDGGSWETIDFDPEQGSYKRGIFYPTLAAMLSARPEDGTYEHRITWNDTSTSTVTLAADRPDYALGIPNDPIFTIGNVSGGAWSRNVGEHDTGVFTFDPTQFADGESFTVTMNAYAGPTNSPGQASAIFVADIGSGSFIEIDEYSAINVPQWGLTDDVSTPAVLTFTKGAGPIDAGDNDPTTYIFNDTSRFELEGEHVNLHSLDDASAELGLVADSVAKGFVYQTVTNFIIVADPSHVPEPSSLTLLCAGGILIARRQRR